MSESYLKPDTCHAIDSRHGTARPAFVIRVRQVFTGQEEFDFIVSALTGPVHPPAGYKLGGRLQADPVTFI